MSCRYGVLISGMLDVFLRISHVSFEDNELARKPKLAWRLQVLELVS